MTDNNISNISKLAADLFCATQTEERLRRDQVSDKQQANQIQFEVASKVRQTIQELGGTHAREFADTRTEHSTN